MEFSDLICRGHHLTNMKFIAKVYQKSHTDFKKRTSLSCNVEVISILINTKMLFYLLFYPGIVSSNTRDFAAKVTYPHLNFSIPVSVFEPLLSRFAQTQDPAVFQELDSAEDEIKRVWRLQISQSKL